MTNSRPGKGAIGGLLLIVFFDMLAFGIIIPFTPFKSEKYNTTTLKNTKKYKK